MVTTIRHDTTPSLSRRRLLKMAIASMLLASGCPAVRQDSEFDSAISELNNQLYAVTGDDDQQALISVIQRIESQARELAAEHQTFVDRFERMLNHHATTEAQLEQLINDYASRRATLRNGLLSLQDELHALLTPEEWAEVVRILNRAGKSLAGYTLQQG